MEAPNNRLKLEVGELEPKEVNVILNVLPFDLTFVGRDDRVKYFSGGRRIFSRPTSVLGKKVQDCHPKKSVHVVNRILDEFRAGKRDVAEFWIKMRERIVYIRYFAVRDAEKNYLGCLEVTQDITDIKQIEGEKRLLDWE